MPQEPTTSYTLKGFTHEAAFRVFTFERISKNRERAEFSVKADLGLILKYKIAVQDLPLLCRGLLEQHQDIERLQSFIYSESDMSQHAAGIAARVEAKRNKYSMRQSSIHTGAGNQFREVTTSRTG